jgi:hypothetical protein
MELLLHVYRAQDLLIKLGFRWVILEHLEVMQCMFDMCVVFSANVHSKQMVVLLSILPKGRASILLKAGSPKWWSPTITLKQGHHRRTHNVSYFSELHSRLEEHGGRSRRFDSRIQ